MNEYKVLEISGSGELTVNITAISEKDARRIFRERYTGTGQREITVTLVRENVPATKQQEREALEKFLFRDCKAEANWNMKNFIEDQVELIRQQVDGCLVDAEVNIENDFGDSMKARWEAAEKRVAQAVKETAEAKEELAQVRRELQTAEDDVNFYRDKVLDSDDLTDIAQLIDGHISQLRDMVKASEVAILENAEHPEAKIFTDAVRERKNLTKDIEYYQALAQRIKHAQGQ